MKLELKHLAGYLPYGLKIYACYNEYVLELEEDCNSEGISVRETIENKHKPILRPLSDLTKHCDDLGFVPMDKLAEIAEVVCLQYSIEFFETSTKYLPNWIIEKLLEWHFDIHGLIENNLAIDINTL